MTTEEALFRLCASNLAGVGVGRGVALCVYCGASHDTILEAVSQRHDPMCPVAVGRRALYLPAGGLDAIEEARGLVNYRERHYLGQRLAR